MMLRTKATFSNLVPLSTLDELYTAEYTIISLRNLFWSSGKAQDLAARRTITEFNLILYVEDSRGVLVKQPAAPLPTH
jgi:hypothetical protein